MNYWIKLITTNGEELFKIFYETREQWLDAIDAEAFDQGSSPSAFFEVGSESDDYDDKIFYQEVEQDEDGFYIPGHFPEVYITKEELIEANKPSQFIKDE